MSSTLTLQKAAGAKKGAGYTDANGNVKFSNLDLGFYLVVETEVSEEVTTTTNPFFVSVPMTRVQDEANETLDEEVAGSSWNYDITVYPKNQTNNPTLDKVVREYNTNPINPGTPKTNAFADSCTASEGDTINNQTRMTIPMITSDASRFTKLEFVDTLDPGQTIVQNTVKITFYKTAEDAQKEQNQVMDSWTYKTGTGATDNAFNKNVELSIEDDEGNPVKGSRMTISLTDLGLDKLNKTDDGSLVGKKDNTVAGVKDDGISDFSGLVMVISYDTTLNSIDDTILGDMGNQNKGTLTYARSNLHDPVPTGITKADMTNTLSDSTEVRTFGIDLTKTFDKGTSASAPDFSKVKFVLQNATDNYFVNASQVAANDGTYYLTDATQTDEASATEFSPNSAGLLNISGLEADDYILTEVNTANGYQLLKSPIYIHVTDTEVEIIESTASQTGLNNGTPYSRTLVTPASATVQSDKANSVQVANMSADTTYASGSSTNARVVLSVVNTKGPNMPQTGGNGTTACTVVGALATATAGWVLFSKKFGKKNIAE